MQGKTLEDVYEIYAQERELFAATIELCTACNWSCQYCLLPRHDSIGLPNGTVKNLLRQLRQLGCYELTLTGGDLFSRKDALDIISYARQLGFAVILMTNLTQVDQNIMRELLPLQIERIECSLFSLVPEKHDSFVGRKGAFHTVWENIHYCKQIGIPIKVGFVALQFNWTELDAFSEFCDELEIQAKYDARVLPRLNKDRCSEKYALHGLELKDSLCFIDRKMGVKYLPKEGSFLCDATQTSLFVTASGEIKLCQLLGSTLGNIQEETLSDIFKKKSREIHCIREAKWDDLKEKCRQCEDRQYCVYCPGLSFLEGKQADGPSPLNCEFARTRRTIAEVKSIEENTPEY